VRVGLAGIQMKTPELASRDSVLDSIVLSINKVVEPAGIAKNNHRIAVAYSIKYK
jgi:hypothetical protein